MAMYSEFTVHPLKMVIFHSYVSLPERTLTRFWTSQFPGEPIEPDSWKDLQDSAKLHPPQPPVEVSIMMHSSARFTQSVDPVLEDNCCDILWNFKTFQDPKTIRNPFRCVLGMGILNHLFLGYDIDEFMDMSCSGSGLGTLFGRHTVMPSCPKNITKGMTYHTSRLLAKSSQKHNAGGKRWKRWTCCKSMMCQGQNSRGTPNIEHQMLILFVMCICI